MTPPGRGGLATPGGTGMRLIGPMGPLRPMGLFPWWAFRPRLGQRVSLSEKVCENRLDNGNKGGLAELFAHWCDNRTRPDTTSAFLMNPFPASPEHRFVYRKFQDDVLPPNLCPAYVSSLKRSERIVIYIKHPEFRCASPWAKFLYAFGV